MSYAVPINAQLLQMIQSDDVEGVRLAIDDGANVNFRGRMDRTPLYYAMTQASVPVIELLLEKGADPNLDDEDGLTPLHIAVVEKRFDVADILLKGGANINFQREKRVTPLHTAFFMDMRADETDRVSFLMVKGADASITMQRNVGEWTVPEIARDEAFKFPHAEVLLKIINVCLDTRMKIDEVVRSFTPEAKEPDSGKNPRPTFAARTRYRL